MTDPLKLIHPRNIKHLTRHINALVEGRLWLKIIIGMFLGVIVGLIIKSSGEYISKGMAENIGSWLALPGYFFLALIQMIVIPLIIASVIRGLASGESVDQLKKLGLRVVVYFLFTSFLAIAIGITAASIIKPGSFVDGTSFQQDNKEIAIDREKLQTQQVDFGEIPGAIMSIVPENPLGEMMRNEMLPIVIFSIIIGIALISLKPNQSKPLLSLLGSIQSVSMVVVRWAMSIAPLAVFGLLAQLTIKTGVDSLTGIGVYVLTVLGGLLVMLCVYLAIVWIFGGWRPWTFLGKVRDVQLLAFSTDSSVATMPLSIKTVQEKLKVRPSISQFIIPVGATVNMDATALFQGVATIFITQLYGLELGLGTLLILMATSVGSSIGTPATPGVGIVVLSAVLTGVGIPIGGIALIIGVDRILEMFRTAINVTGDLAASIVMNRIVKTEMTYDDEISYEQAVEKEHEKTGDDVITGEIDYKKGSQGIFQSFWEKIKGIFRG